MTVPDSLSRKPRMETDMETLLRMQKHPDDEPIMVIKVKTKSGKTQKVLMTFKSRRQLRVQARHNPSPKSTAATVDSEEIQETFDYTNDPDYGEIYQTLSSGQADPERPSLQLYSVRDGNLIWVDKRYHPRVCVPLKYLALILHELHDAPLGSHFGEDKTYHELRQRYMWPHQQHHVEQYVRSCDACQKNKASHRLKLGTPQLPYAPSSPWESVAIDFCGPFPMTARRNDYVAGFIDKLTREVVLVPCQKTITAKQTARLFVQYVLRIAGGVPRYVCSDLGPQFISHFWEYLWKRHGSKVVLSAHPASNSLIERQNKTFLEALKAYLNALQDDWDEHLVPYEFAYNVSVNPSLGDSPFFLNHGRVATMQVALAHLTPNPAEDEFVMMLQNRIASALDHIRSTQARAADWLSR
eukprot:2892746-Rhodomonas_salina.2